MDVTYVYSDDWEGLYVDGFLAAEDHNLSMEQVLSALGLEYLVIEADVEWMEEEGTLPDRVEEVRGEY
jgi:hypothetical protein